MYLHLGQDTVVRMEDVLGVFDLENASISPQTERQSSISPRSVRQRYENGKDLWMDFPDWKVWRI